MPLQVMLSQLHLWGLRLVHGKQGGLPAPYLVEFWEGWEAQGEDQPASHDISNNTASEANSSTR